MNKTHYVVLDSETTMDHKEIRIVCIKTYDKAKNSLRTYACKTAAHLQAALDQEFEEAELLITFNGEGFDIPVIKEVWGVDIQNQCKVHNVEHFDVYIDAKLKYHNRKSHSLDSLVSDWLPEGTQNKVPIDDFDTVELSALVERCLRDCKLTFEIYNIVTNPAYSTVSKGKWDHPRKVEQRVKALDYKQSKRGICFDSAMASQYRDEIQEEMKEIEDSLECRLPAVMIPASQLKFPPKKQFNKDGSLSKNMSKYLEDHSWVSVRRRDGSWYACGIGPSALMERDLPFHEPIVIAKRATLSNQGPIKDWLLEKGWKPKYWNTKKDKTTGAYEKTSPRLTNPITKEPDEGLETLGIDWASDLSRWLMLRSRKNVLASDTGKTGWLNKVDEMGIIHPEADTLGANTGRYIHRNIVNIPRVTSDYGTEFRSLFTARPGMVMVGWDASQLEARMEAHYTYPFDSGEYAKKILEGDIHQSNMEALELPDRDAAKTFKYAITYGAGEDRLMEIFGWSRAHAQAVLDKFWRENLALARLKADIQSEWISLDKKYIVGLDGRLISTRSKHSLLNAKFQSGGAIAMKHSMLLADNYIHKYYNEDETSALIRYHDEEQWEALPGIAGHVGQLGVRSIEDAGKFLKLNVPLEAEYKIGGNWAETH